MLSRVRSDRYKLLRKNWIIYKDFCEWYNLYQKFKKKHVYKL